MTSNSPGARTTRTDAAEHARTGTAPSESESRSESQPKSRSESTSAWGGGLLRMAAVRYTPQLLLLLLVVVMLVLKPATLSAGSLREILINAVPIALLALGAMWVLIGGGLDLSAGYGVAMCALVMGGRLQHGSSVGTAIGLALLAGLALGLVNGVLVGVVGMPAFIATLATMVCVQGLTLILGRIGTVIVDSSTLTNIGTGKVGGIPIMVLCGLGVAVVVWFLSRYTRFGLYTYSVGSNREATTGRGVPVVRQDILIYMFSGLMTAITAVLLVSHVQVVDPNIAGMDQLLDAFAATILGGTSLFGGRGSAVGTVTGALIMSLMTTSLVTLGVGAQQVQLLKGAMIVVAVVIDALVRALERGGRSAARAPTTTVA